MDEVFFRAPRGQGVEVLLREHAGVVQEGQRVQELMPGPCPAPSPLARDGPAAPTGPGPAGRASAARPFSSPACPSPRALSLEVLWGGRAQPAAVAGPMPATGPAPRGLSNRAGKS